MNDTWLIRAPIALVPVLLFLGALVQGDSYKLLRLKTVLTIASTGARTPINVILGRGPLAYYGRISYGLYMTHIMVFIYFGWFDARMDSHGMPGSLAVVAFRLVATTLVGAKFDPSPS